MACSLLGFCWEGGIGYLAQGSPMGTGVSILLPYISFPFLPLPLQFSLAGEGGRHGSLLVKRHQQSNSLVPSPPF